MTKLKKIKLVSLKSVSYYQSRQLKLSRELFIWFYKAKRVKQPILKVRRRSRLPLTT
jgi:hypothetical protein